MNLTSIGDLAGHYNRLTTNASLKREADRLAKEMSTGRAADVPSHLRGNYSHLSEIKHSLSLLDGFKVTAQEAATRTTFAQAALEQIDTQLGDLSSDLLSIANSATQQSLSTLAQNAVTTFSISVSALNSRSANQSIFAGAATSSPALADATVILDELRTVVAGSVTTSDYLDAIDDWFDIPGGGFDTFAYFGSTEDGPDYQLDENLSVPSDIRADATEIRDVLKAVAKVALIDDPGVGFPTNLQSTLMITTGQEIIGAKDNLIGLRAELGVIEERIAQSQVYSGAQRTSLEMTYNALVGVDEYEAAANLENAQFRLESLYAVTVRMSQLSLVDFLR